MQGPIRWMAMGLVMTGTVWGQTAPAGEPVAPARAQAATAPAVEASGGTIKGTVKAGTVPLPGVGVTATNTLTGKKYATTTDVDGSFAMAIPRNGRYVVKAELAAFAPETKEILINAAGQNGGKPEQVADFGLQLASRVQQQEERQTAATSAGVARGVQALSVAGDGLDVADASASGGGNTGVQVPSLAGLGGDAAGTDSVTVNGAMGQTNGLAGYSEDDIRQRVQDAIAQAQRQGGAAGDMANAVVGMLGGMMGGQGFGGPAVADGWGGRRWTWWSRRRRRWGGRIPRVQSDAAARGSLLSGRKWGVERSTLLCSRSFGRARRPGSETIVHVESLWRQLYWFTIDSWIGEGQHEAVHLFQCDGTEEHQSPDLQRNGADASGAERRLLRAGADAL